MFMQHSDVKPENVMLAADGCAVLCDLGLGSLCSSRAPGAGHGGMNVAYVDLFAWVLVATITELHFHLHAGTLLYLAPELVGETLNPATFASDI